MSRSKWFSLLLLLVILTTVFINILHLNSPWENGLKGTIGLRHSAQFAVHFIKYGFQFSSFTPIHVMIGDIPLIYHHHPPLFFLLIGACFKVFGIFIWSARLIPLFASIGILLLTFQWVKRIYNHEVALLTTAIVSIIPVFFWYGTIVWFEGTTIFLMLASLIAYHRFMDSPSRRKFLLLSVCTVLAMLIDWPAYLLVPVFLVDYYLVEKKKGVSILLLPILGLSLFIMTNLHYLLVTGLLECMPFYNLIVYGLDSRLEFDLREWFIAHWKDESEWLTIPIYGTSFIYLISAIFRQRFRRDRWLFYLTILGFVYLAIFHRHSAEHEFFLLYLVLPYSLTFSVALYQMGQAGHPGSLRMAALGLLLVTAALCIQENWKNTRDFLPDK
ncbi:MAG: glycosyltransferase family 39 protein, partial [Planctomycetes bacterium]|nr:glycosyltransferase family 39 protein [Planctomycetota bacterium]